MCLYPRLIKNRKYTETKKNGGIIPHLHDDRIKYVPVGCGNCMECAKKKANAWRTRLLEDIKENKNAIFITLTFSDESIAELTKECKGEGYNLDNEIARLAIRRFLERHRKKYKKSIRHWLVTEIGHEGTENIHMHGLLYINEQIYKNKGVQNIKEEITNIWKYGHIWQGTFVNEATINYIVKYVTKKDLKHKEYKPIILTSAGIGNNYTNNINSKENTYNGEDTKEYYRTRKGNKTSLPIYWRNKIYTEEEREKLWLLKLDKEERFVLGQKYDVSNTQETYEQAVKIARKKNEELGYGSDQRKFEQEIYEREKRILAQKTRIAKGNRNACRGASSMSLKGQKTPL